MAIANLQAQMANLTSQLSQYAERTTMQEYQANQHQQRGWESDNTWSYQAQNQVRNNLFPNPYNSDWSDHSSSMWWEPQQVPQEGYWHPYEEFYQYAQPNSGSSIDCNQILDELISLTQGSQTQAKEAQHEGYWQPYEEFYATPMQPPQPPPQETQTNSGSSMDYDQILDVLTSMAQGLQNQAKKIGEMKNQLGEMVEFMGQLQEQSELSNSNSTRYFEINEPITLESGVEVGHEPKTSQTSLNMDEQLLLEEEENDKAIESLEEALL